MSVLTVAATLAGKRGLGWQINPRDERDEAHIFTPAASKRAPANQLLALSPSSLASCAVLRFDQGSTGSCVAQAICGAISTGEMYLSTHTSLKAQSDLFAYARYRLLSRRALYSCSRATHGAVKVDNGTYIRAALRWLRRHGCPLEKAFGWSEFLINQKVPADLLNEGYEFAELEYENIVATGDAKIEMIQAATLEGRPVVFGSNVSRSYMRHRGDGVYRPLKNEPIEGGHARYIVHVEPDTGHCLEVNSWSRAWGLDGTARVHVEWVKSDYRDLAIIKNWRRVQAAEASLRHAT